MDQRPLLTTEHLARRYQCSTDTIIRWTQPGKIKGKRPLPFIKFGRPYLFDPDEVAEWEKQFSSHNEIANLDEDPRQEKASA